MHKKILLSLGIISFLFSNPNDGYFAVGKGEFAKNQENLTIKTENHNSVIEWDLFSIAKKENVHFIQPNINSATLNRIKGNEFSEILGKITSNGKIYLLNPKGVLIGPDAEILVSAFLATTLDTLDVDFLKGKELPLFGTSEKTISNFGKIKALNGDVFLVAYEVKNQGNIEAKGEKSLASIKYFIMEDNRKGKIWIKSFDISEENIYSACFANTSKNAEKLISQGERTFLIND